MYLLHIYRHLGKGENIWDRFTHVGDNIEDDSNGDVACDSYNKYMEDIELMVNMGVRSLSIENWMILRRKLIGFHRRQYKNLAFGYEGKASG